MVSTVVYLSIRSIKFLCEDNASFTICISVRPTRLLWLMPVSGFPRSAAGAMKWNKHSFYSVVHSCLWFALVERCGLWPLIPPLAFSHIILANSSAEIKPVHLVRSNTTSTHFCSSLSADLWEHLHLNDYYYFAIGSVWGLPNDLMTYARSKIGLLLQQCEARICR